MADTLRSGLKRLVPRQIRVLRSQFLSAVSSRKSAWLKPRRNALQVSILTDPVPEGVFALSRQRPNGSFGGHPAVTRSVVEGLRKLQVPFSYNPRSVDDLAQTVVVLAGVRALRQMIQLKQLGYVACLIAGPHVVDDPGSHGGILAAPEIDGCVGPAAWCRLAGRFLPALASRCVPWTAGVDLEFWSPGTGAQRDQVLLYDKQVHGVTAAIGPYREALERSGHRVTTLNYGGYSAGRYRELLRRSRFMVAFSRHETQGIALAEAWACDVPTFILQNCEPTLFGVAYGGSAAPYLSAATGRFFSNIEDFEALLSQWGAAGPAFQPRRWCGEHMSDEICARSLLSIAVGMQPTAAVLHPGAG